MSHFAAVAVSATSSSAAVAALDGEILCLARGGGFLVTSSDVAELQRLLHVLLNDLDRQLQLVRSTELRALCDAIHISADVPSESATAKLFRDAIALTYWKDLTVHVYHRGLCSLIGALGHEIGALVKSGTSAFAFVRNGTQCQRVGGWSPLIEGDGGAYSIGKAALNLIFQDSARVEGQDALSAALMEQIGAKDRADCLRWICKFESAASIHVNVATLSETVIRLQESSDNPAATFILKEASARLFQHLSAALTSVALPNPPRIGLYGGILQRSSFVARELRQTIRACYPDAVVCQASARPLAGLIWHLLRASGYADSLPSWLASLPGTAPSDRLGYLVPRFTYRLEELK